MVLSRLPDSYCRGTLDHSPACATFPKDEIRREHAHNGPTLFTIKTWVSECEYRGTPASPLTSISLFCRPEAYFEGHLSWFCRFTIVTTPSPLLTSPEFQIHHTAHNKLVRYPVSPKNTNSLFKIDFSFSYPKICWKQLAPSVGSRTKSLLHGYQTSCCVYSNTWHPTYLPKV